MNWSDMSHRERDALVHIHVMALPEPEMDHDGAYPCPTCGSPMWTPKTFPGEGRSRCSACQEWHYSVYRPYTEDIACAWEVVEKMREEGRPPAIMHYVGRWHVRFHEGGFETIYSEAEADTAPEAIALAALRAKGVEV